MVTNETVQSLLDDPVAQELLRSTNMAKLAYVWEDGTPRVVPIWFHWSGQEIVMGTLEKNPKVKHIRDNSPVAVSIDRNEWPYHALNIRGTAHVTTVEGVVPEYVTSAERYLGPEQGKGWVETVRKLFPYMVRIAVEPLKVSIIDFEKRFPKAFADGMAAQSG